MMNLHQYSAFMMSFHHTFEMKPAQFVVSFYDNFYWVGMVSEIDQENEDVKIKFMHPHFPSKSLKWADNDVCWIAIIGVPCTINPPSLVTHTGKQYLLDENKMNGINKSIDYHEGIQYSINIIFTVYTHNIILVLARIIY